MGKWIINNGVIKMSRCIDYHKELSSNHDTTKGGGFFLIVDSTKRLYLYGSSHDFGQCTLEETKEAFLNTVWSMQLENYELFFCGEDNIAYAMLNSESIGVIER